MFRFWYGAPTVQGDGTEWQAANNLARRSILIEAGERDEHVGMALVHSWAVMGEVFFTVCRHFKIKIPDTEQELKETWSHLEP